MEYIHDNEDEDEGGGEGEGKGGVRMGGAAVVEQSAGRSGGEGGDESQDKVPHMYIHNTNIAMLTRLAKVEEEVRISKWRQRWRKRLVRSLIAVHPISTDIFSATR